jgi:hypothetical protein
MSRCINERRHVGRRASDRTDRWKLMVAMGVLFIGWAGAVYIHYLITQIT